MIIRTSIERDRALANFGSKEQSSAWISKREQRRLENTKHPEGKANPQPKKVTEAPVEVSTMSLRKTVPVREDDLNEITESAVPAPTIVEPDQTDVQPGTAVIRSKVLEEIANKYKEEPDEKPKKKYKVISIG